MENLKESNSFDSSIEDSINESYNDLYKCLEFSGARHIVSRRDAKETLESMIDHFSSREEYEKCALICSILKKYS
jgi:hypothetical protein